MASIFTVAPKLNRPASVRKVIMLSIAVSSERPAIHCQSDHCIRGVYQISSPAAAAPIVAMKALAPAFFIGCLPVGVYPSLWGWNRRPRTPIIS